MKRDRKLYKIAVAAVIGAVYAVLTIVLAPISFGPLQFRISEVLCILPFFFSGAAPGLFIGCVIANLIGSGEVFDIIFGSLATLLAAVCTAAIGSKAWKREVISWGRCIAACAMPVLFNAPIIGAVLSGINSPTEFWEGFVLFGGMVGLGELAVLFVLGLPLMRYMLKNDKIMVFFAKLRNT